MFKRSEYKMRLLILLIYIICFFFQFQLQRFVYRDSYDRRTLTPPPHSPFDLTSNAEN